jgi:hypothetical protein
MCAVTSVLLLPALVVARPVSYPGGYTIMQKHNADFTSLHAHYSPTARYSIGMRSEYWRTGDHWLTSVAVNNLLKRWNLPEAQANLYLQSGIGVAYSDSGERDPSEPLGYTGLSSDWENRRFFFQYRFRLIEAGYIDRRAFQQGRVGVAPYVGDYGDLHTWIMLQVDHMPGTDETIRLTPLIRFFKDVYMWEVGVSNRGDVLFNSTIRF